MYSVFLVEDERLIREGIEQLISWEEYGFTFVGDAPDGELAWPLIQKRKPDIVITDIMMPFMDGLSLSRLIKKELPKTTIIILSGHDDFSYAKEAISIGVHEYLLKPLSREQLVDALLQLKAHKDLQSEQEQHYFQFQQEMQEYMSTSRRAFLDTLLSGQATPPELLRRAEKLQLDLLAERYNVVLFVMEEDCPQNAPSALLLDLQMDLADSFASNRDVVMFSSSVDILFFLIKTDTAQIDAATNKCVETIRSLCLPLEGSVSWSLEVGTPVERLSAVSECYLAVRRKLFRRPSLADTVTELSLPATVIDFEVSDINANKVDQRIVSNFLVNGRREDMDAFVEDYLTAIGQGAIESMMFRQYVVLNIQFTVSVFLGSLGYEREKLQPPENLPLQKVLLCLEDSKAYIRALLEWALSLRDQVVASRSSGILQKALRYMHAHFCESDISLNSVAQAANISATYFSAVFSQQMGQTFVEYLTELRMERAKELLRCSNKSSGDIAFEVGYSAPHYFSFLFKKVNGCSPRDYRTKKKNM